MKVKRIHFETIGSTNTWAKEHISKFEDHVLTIVSAGSQTAGRGRFKRKWHSPKNQNIYVSFCFSIDMNRMDVGHVPQLLALSTAKVLESLGFTPKLKWPNDILLSNKKVGGILCETSMYENKRGVICGIGLNVNMPKEELKEIDRPATSLFLEIGELFSIDEIFELLSLQFKKDLIQFLSKGFSSYFGDYENRLWVHKGELITFHDNFEMIQGQFISLNKDGTITLLIKNSVIKTFHTGEFVA